MSDQPSTRRRFQFRLRTLFVVTAVVAALTLFAKAALEALKALAEIDDPPYTQSR